MANAGGPMPPGPGYDPLAGPSAPAPLDPDLTRVSLASAALWSAILGGFAAGVGGVAAWQRRRAPRPATLVVPEGERVAPVRITADEVAGALAGPLRGYRVVALGPVPADAAVGTCGDAGVLPSELVSAIERFAATPGPSPALLVTDLAQLDRPGPESPAEALARAVDGRFPLFVVDAPPSWAAFTPEAAA